MVAGSRQAIVNGKGPNSLQVLDRQGSDWEWACCKGAGQEERCGSRSAGAGRMAGAQDEGAAAGTEAAAGAAAAAAAVAVARQDIAGADRSRLA